MGIPKVRDIRNIICGYLNLFALTEVADNVFDDKLITSLESPYIKRTNKNEQYEVLSKIVFLVNEYLKNNPECFIFGITKNTDNKIFEKLFSTDFEVIENEDAFYFIKKENYNEII